MWYFLFEVLMKLYYVSAHVCRPVIWGDISKSSFIAEPWVITRTEGRCMHVLFSSWKNVGLGCSHTSSRLCCVSSRVKLVKLPHDAQVNPVFIFVPSLVFCVEIAHVTKLRLATQLPVNQDGSCWEVACIYGSHFEVGASDCQMYTPHTHTHDGSAGCDVYVLSYMLIQQRHKTSHPYQSKVCFIEQNMLSIIYV